MPICPLDPSTGSDFLPYTLLITPRMWVCHRSPPSSGLYQDLLGEICKTKVVTLNLAWCMCDRMCVICASIPACGFLNLVLLDDSAQICLSCLQNNNTHPSPPQPNLLRSRGAFVLLQVSLSVSPFVSLAGVFLLGGGGGACAAGSVQPRGTCHAVALLPFDESPRLCPVAEGHSCEAPCETLPSSAFPAAQSLACQRAICQSALCVCVGGGQGRAEQSRGPSAGVRGRAAFLWPPAMFAGLLCGPGSKQTEEGREVVGHSHGTLLLSSLRA